MLCSRFLPTLSLSFLPVFCSGSLYPKAILFFFSYCYRPWLMFNKLLLCIVGPFIPTNLSSPKEQLFVALGLPHLLMLWLDGGPAGTTSQPCWCLSIHPPRALRHPLQLKGSVFHSYSLIAQAPGTAVHTVEDAIFFLSLWRCHKGSWGFFYQALL